MSMSHTATSPAVRLAGSCGIASGALLLAAPILPTPDGVTRTIWVLGWLLLLPFFAGIATLARTHGDRRGWLTPVISAASAVLVSIHLTNVAVEHVANTVSKASPVHEPLHAVGGALFTLAMLPFGVAIVASAASGLVGRSLPRWLCWVALAVGVTALVNGTLVGSESAWGFLLAVVWMFTAGTVLAVRGTRNPVASELAPVTN
jgi:hypothetical protein